MKRLRIELDDETASRLDAVAPARSRRRSEFIRFAIEQALGEVEQQRTREAYARQPDTIGDAYVDPRMWESPPGRSTRAGRGG